MARPRIFISSTFYDLRHVRQDLERFVRELGYEPVRNETGAIPYDKSEKLETAAYREVELCDIIVSIVGGRYGSESRDDPGYSISQAELRRALDQGIQVFIFIEKSVLAEFSTYQLNRNLAELRYRFVDNPKIYEFIEQIYALPQNNTIIGFETSTDIIEYLRVQWAGLFQRFLQQQARLAAVDLLNEMNTTAQTLRDLVTYFREQRTSQDEAIRSILLTNHPAFRRFADVTGTTYRVFFTTEKELNTWLKARSWKPISKNAMDSDSIAEWLNIQKGKYLKLTVRLFDSEGRLEVMTADDWKPEWIQVLDLPEEDGGGTPS